MSVRAVAAVGRRRGFRLAAAGVSVMLTALAGWVVLPAAAVAGEPLTRSLYLVDSGGNLLHRLAGLTVSPGTWDAGDTVTITLSAPQGLPSTCDLDHVGLGGQYPADPVSFSPVIPDRRSWSSWDKPYSGAGDERVSGHHWTTDSELFYRVDDALPVTQYTVVLRPQESGGGPVDSAPDGFPYAGVGLRCFGADGRVLGRDSISDDDPAYQRFGTRFVVSGDGPEADFVWAPSPSDPHTIGFQSRATDVEDDQDDLDHVWDFGDGETATGRTPQHTYDDAGEYDVTLTVTDTDGLTDSRTKTVIVGDGLVVNSTGDDPAVDAAERGCDTGGTIGDEPECTLRAAVETAQASGGGTIGFGIEGSPVIALGASLSTLSVPVTIDGTTQDGGWVEVSGGGQAVLGVSGGTATIKGLALHGATGGVYVTGGAGHRIEGNRLGLDLAGTPTDDTDWGAAVVAGSGSVVTGNVSGAKSGVIVGGTGTGAPVEVSRNHLGVSDAGVALGDPLAGVFNEGAGTVVTGNTVRGATVGIIAYGAGAAGTLIEDNEVGVAGDTVLGGVGWGIRVDGAPRVSVAGNRVVAGSAAIGVTGSLQADEDEEGDITLRSPDDDLRDGPATGGGTVIVENTLGASGGTASHGVAAWAGAAGLTVADNVVRTATQAGIRIDGGSAHEVDGNTLGDSAAPLPGHGVQLTGSAATVTGNQVHAVLRGVLSTEEAEGIEIAGNQLIGHDGAFYGVEVAGDPTGLVVRQNTVTGTKAFGLVLKAPGANVAGNVVTGQGDAIVVRGEGVVVRENRVGVNPGSDTVIGVSGSGIQIEDGDADVRRNVIAGAGGDGIHVATGAKATLRANRIWSVTGSPIEAPEAPDAPVIGGVVISDTEDAQRSTLLVAGLPETGAGTIEVFANDSCDPATGGQAKQVVEVTRTVAAGTRAKAVQFPSNRDHFTITYTDADGSTSELSGCVSRTVYPDSDGDGSVDPLDDLFGTAGDASSAVLVTANEQLLGARVAPYDAESNTGGGTLAGLSVADDPAPGSHPVGWSLPYGVLSFRVEGIAPGGRTSVALVGLDGTTPILGNGYWKYGPSVPGAASAWFDFAYDDASGTGARSGVVDLGTAGFRPAFLLHFADGARGDSDGAMNGTITDPGGPVTFTPGPIRPPVPTPPAPTYNVCTSAVATKAGAKATKLTAKPVAKSIKRKARGKVAVTGTYKVKRKVRKATGTVVICEGATKLASSSLRKGKRTVTLPRLTPGKHGLTVRYLGSGSSRPKDKTVVIRVRR